MNDRVPRLAELARQVSESSNRLVDLARAAGHPELGDLLVAASKRWPDEDTTVLVAGEACSGKSSLVNALAGRLDPPLLPLGSGVTLVRAAPVDEVRVHRPGSETERHPLDRIPQHLEPDATVEALVVDPPMGDGLVLVDTPSLGGPGSGSRAVIGALVAAADAVIVTTSADAPLTAAEVDVLEAVRRRAGVALAVVTHTDRFRGWRTICEESDAAARRRDPDLLAAPTLPFALPLVEDAVVEEDPDNAADLAREAGFTAVLEAVHAIRERARHVRLAGLVHAALDVSDRLLDEVGPVAGPERRQQLVEERDRLRQRARTVPVDFADGCSILRDGIGVDVGREVQVILESIETDLGEHKDVDALVDATVQHLDALRVRTDARLAHSLDELLRSAMDAVAADGAESGDDPEDAPSRSLSATVNKVSTALRLRLLQAAVSTSGGAALLYTMANPAAGGLREGAMGISMLIGGIGAAEAFREARQQRTLQDARNRVRSVVEQWRSEYLATMREHLLRQQRERERLLRDTIDGALADVESQLAALDRPTVNSSDPAALAASLTALRLDLETVEGHLRDIIRLA